MAETRVLFLCRGNTARSQIAEAILRSRAGERYRAYSAGLVAFEEIHPLAVRVMAEWGIDMGGHRPKSLPALRGWPEFEYVITLCERTQRLHPRVCATAQHLYWPLPDPAEFSGTEEVRLAKFRALRTALETRICAWLEAREARPSRTTPPSACPGQDAIRQVVVAAGTGGIRGCAAPEVLAECSRSAHKPRVAWLRPEGHTSALGGRDEIEI